jgi:hypothetical protein
VKTSTENRYCHQYNYWLSSMKSTQKTIFVHVQYFYPQKQTIKSTQPQVTWKLLKRQPHLHHNTKRDTVTIWTKQYRYLEICYRILQAEVNAIKRFKHTGVYCCHLLLLSVTTTHDWMQSDGTNRQRYTQPGIINILLLRNDYIRLRQDPIL